MLESFTFDPLISQTVASIRNEWLTWIMRGFSSAHGAFLLLIPLIGVWLWRGKGQFRRRLFVFLAFGIGIVFNNAICDAIKVRVERPRPFEDQVVETPIPHEKLVNPKKPHRSFPSGHSMNSMCAVILALFLWPRVKPWLLFLPLVVGFSRIYLGVHYFTDVMSGLLMGCIIGCLLGCLFQKLLRKPHSWLSEAPAAANPPGNEPPEGA